MAAPAHSVRTLPVGYKLPDGYKSLICLANNPGIQFWEMEPKPPSPDGGEPIMTSTMHNVRYHTSAPRTLIKWDPASGSCAYDPDVLTDIIAQINVPQSFTQSWPDGSYLDFWGWLQKFEMDALKEGDMPKASYTIPVSNYDPVNNVEAGPVFHEATGT